MQLQVVETQESPEDNAIIQKIRTENERSNLCDGVRVCFVCPLCNSKVSQLYLSIQRNEHVARLYVSVDDFHFVQVLDCIDQLAEVTKPTLLSDPKSKEVNKKR